MKSRQTIDRRAEQRTAGRVLPVRLIGLALGAVAIAAAMHELQRPWPLYVLLAINALLWPPLAYRLSAQAESPMLAERRNLVADSALGGMWIAVIAFNPVPSLVLLMTLAIDKMAFGGWRLLVRALAAQVLACALTAIVIGKLAGYHIITASSLPVILACAPHLLVYPLLVSYMAYRLLATINRQKERISALARTDMLTGLYNRSHWGTLAQNELERQRRRPDASMLLLIDIDRFKAINDTYGHLLGDDVIRAVAGVIRSDVRATDTAARYGGDEFVVILHGASMDEAERVGNRIRLDVRGLNFGQAPELRLSTSIGIAAADDEVRSLDSWFA
ncbi:MAG: diguanylate cyclase, partial [Solimonas sp.]